MALPPSAFIALGDGLDTGRVGLATSSFGFARLRGVNDDHASRIAGTFQRIVRASAGEPVTIEEKAVATALRVASRLRSVERLARPDLEIAWTGPAASGPLVRSTSVVLEEMLEGVRDAGEVFASRLCFNGGIREHYGACCRSASLGCKKACEFIHSFAQ